MTIVQPDTRTVPAAPGKDAEVWRCRHCGARLGLVAAGWLFTRFKRREIIARLPAVIYCEDCREKNARQGDA